MLIKFNPPFSTNTFKPKLHNKTLNTFHSIQQKKKNKKNLTIIPFFLLKTHNLIVIQAGQEGKTISLNLFRINKTNEQKREKEKKKNKISLSSSFTNSNSENLFNLFFIFFAHFIKKQIFFFLTTKIEFFFFFHHRIQSIEGSMDPRLRGIYFGLCNHIEKIIRTNNGICIPSGKSERRGQGISSNDSRWKQMRSC